MPQTPSDSIVLPRYATLLLAIDGPVATVTLNRPDVLNALNAHMFDDLETVTRMLVADPSVRVILLTGAGDKAFAAGADIAELAAMAASDTSDTSTQPRDEAPPAEQKSLRGQAVFRLIESCGKPVIAVLNGFALGGGCELALACTLRLAADTARLGQPEVKLGLLPGYGGSQRLPRLIGSAAALRYLLTGDLIPAPEALRLGLVDEVVPAAELASHAQALATRIAGQAPLAITAILEAVDQGRDLPLDDALRLEAQLFARLAATSDMQEGTAAFLAKRKAVWSGR